MLVSSASDSKNFFIRNNIKKILILCPQGIGDTLMAMPLIDLLKNIIKEMQIGVLVRNNNISEIFKRAKIVNELYPLKNYSLKNYIKIAKKIIKFHYDISTTTSNINQFKGSLFPFLCGIKLRLGEIKNQKLHFYNRYIKYKGRIHKIRQNIKILSLLNLNIDNFNPPKFIIYDEEKKETSKFLSIQKANNYFLTGIVSSSNPRGAGITRRWAPEKFAELCDSLIESGKIPVFLGNKQDKVKKKC